MLVTPAEKLDILVEDAPFVAVELRSEGEGAARDLAFRLNTGDLVVAGPDHPLRFDAGPHPAMYGPFHIFRFQIRELPDVVFTESLVGAAYLDDVDDVSTFLEALDRMCAQAAPAHSTAAILDGIRKEI